jgi:hypothetical protein
LLFANAAVVLGACTKSRITKLLLNQIKYLTVAATAASSSSKEALVHAEIAMSEWKQCVLAVGASIVHLYRSAYLQVGK